jgi:hypothetical protein
MKLHSVLLILFAISLINCRPQRLSDHIDNVKEVSSVLGEAVKAVGGGVIEGTSRVVKVVGEGVINTAITGERVVLGAVGSVIRGIEEEQRMG